MSQAKSSTLRQLLVQAEETFRCQDAFRYKVKVSDKEGKKQVEIQAKTYQELRQDTQKVSALLETLGERGSHIAIIGATSYSWVVSYFGIVNSGRVAVPLDALLPSEDICELIRRADVEILIFDGSKSAVAAAAKQACPQLRYLISMEESLSPKAGDLKDLLFLWEELKKQQEGYSYEPAPTDLATIMFTSGTTGKSKGVMLTHRNLAENATCLDMGFAHGTVVMSVLPIHHAYCLSMDILKTLSLGSAICINDSLMRVAKNIKLFEPEMMLMVPLMIETLAKKLEETAWIPAPLVKARVFGRQFKSICSGGAYLNPAYVETFAKYGITIYQGYGMTECSPVISSNYIGNMKAGSVGKLMPNCEAKIVDEELWVKGSSVMQGYYRMPRETAETLEDGWLKTGDLGYVDEEGFVFLTGRKKNLIITPNGENVSPEEIENKLGENRLVQEVLVREKKGVIEAEIFPDYEYAKKKKIKDIREGLQQMIDEYNKQAPLYKRIYALQIREKEFEKNTTRKIKRF
ncbi:MAG: AMP-binding protein [Lachnospiraceae bacterium]|nr:AMP-binding protein [Lachnospiraceae bacterium]MDD7051190.1 AMP-binding protein [Lachnospiraceae bacterium]MDY4097410.1 AMP-binding protein [Lachnospiraceae bacterium]